MGTRGALGFRVDGKDKVSYNHYDSYPEGLGQDVVNFLHSVRKEMTPGELVAQVRNIRVVSNEEDPSEEDILKLQKWMESKVSSGRKKEWYVLLRKTQGKPFAILESGFMEDGLQFLADSLFCEWAYIINLDEEVLEVYRGFQKEPHDKGRFSDLDFFKDHRGSDQYYPVALIGEIPFGNLPEDLTDVVVYDEEEDQYIVKV